MCGVMNCFYDYDYDYCMSCVFLLSRQAWQGNADVKIDRYDVRTHIDHITESLPARRAYATLR